MPELMEEVVAFIERRTAELDERKDGAAPRLTESVVPAALVRATPTLQDDDTGIATINLRFHTQVLARIDAAAKRLGISRTAWLHLAAGERLEGRLKLPRFRGHPNICVQGVHDGEDETTLPTGIPSPDGRAGPRRPLAGGAGAGV
jgi:hypothetical protein